MIPAPIRGRPAPGSTYVVEAERLGADCVWSAESWGTDAVAPLAFLAVRTSRIRLGAGVMQAGTRTPARPRFR